MDRWIAVTLALILVGEDSFRGRNSMAADPPRPNVLIILTDDK